MCKETGTHLIERVKGKDSEGERERERERVRKKKRDAGFILLMASNLPDASPMLD